MTEELKEIGLNVGHRRVGRLVRQNGISVVRTRKYKATTDSNHKFNIAPNLLDRDFNADAPNQKWAGDISYIWTREGWLYLAVILDLHSRRVVGWAVSNRMKRDLEIRALKMAIAFRQPPKDCIHHTDRGSQYCSHDYQKIRKRLRRDRRGCLWCWRNGPEKQAVGLKSDLSSAIVLGPERAKRVPLQHGHQERRPSLRACREAQPSI